MAEEISLPLCEARKITMVSSGGGEVGAAKLSGEVLDIMTRVPEAVEKLTGVSITQVTHRASIRSACRCSAAASGAAGCCERDEELKVCVLQVSSRTG